MFDVLMCQFFGGFLWWFSFLQNNFENTEEKGQLLALLR